MVIYERQHSPHGRVRIHDDCIARSPEQRAAIQLEQHRAVVRALDVLVEQLGEDAVRSLLERASVDTPLRAEVQQIKKEWAHCDGAWTAPVVVACGEV